MNRDAQRGDRSYRNNVVHIHGRSYHVESAQERIERGGTPRKVLNPGTEARKRGRELRSYSANEDLHVLMLPCRDTSLYEWNSRAPRRQACFIVCRTISLIDYFSAG